MSKLAIRGLLTQGQFLFVRKAGKLLIHENLQRSDSDSSESETDPRIAQMKESFNYVDVMAARLNEVD